MQLLYQRASCLSIDFSLFFPSCIVTVVPVTQDELATTKRSYEDQLSMMSDHLCSMNETLSKQREEIDTLKLGSKVQRSAIFLLCLLFQALALRFVFICHTLSVSVKINKNAPSLKKSDKNPLASGSVKDHFRSGSEMWHCKVSVSYEVNREVIVVLWLLLGLMGKAPAGTIWKNR